MQQKNRQWLKPKIKALEDTYHISLVQLDGRKWQSSKEIWLTILRHLEENAIYVHLV